MRLRALVFLLGSLALSACVTAGPQGYPVNGYGVPVGRASPEMLTPPPGAPGAGALAGTPPGLPPGAAHARSIAVLLPLSGPAGDRAQALLKAAQLALDQPGAPPLDVRDTGGTPDGAAAAAQQAIGAGDGIIVGPLTAGETAAVAGPAHAAGIPVLAFTSDPTQARPGVWTLGLTPGQQVRRLVSYSAGTGMQRFAALLPENEFGRLMGAALTEAVTATGGPAPNIHTYSPGMQNLNAAVRDLADYVNRRGPIDDQVKAARARNDAEGRRLATELAQQAPPPPPFDALLLADTGTQLAAIGSLLPYYDVTSPPVRIMGPALWASPAVRGSAGAVLGNALYAAPDPAARGSFDAAFNAKYGAPPGPLADLAYDATSLARVTMQQGGDPVQVLIRPEGFTGSDGVLALSPDGQVRRGLAVFQLQNGTPTIVDPAPQTLAGPSS